MGSSNIGDAASSSGDRSPLPAVAAKMSGRGRDGHLGPLRPRVGLQQRDLPPRELQFQPLVGRLILIALKTLLIKTRVLALDLHQRVGGELARGPPSG